MTHDSIPISANWYDALLARAQRAESVLHKILHDNGLNSENAAEARQVLGMENTNHHRAIPISADELTELRAERDAAIGWNHRVSVCAKHTGDIVDGACVICELATLRALATFALACLEETREELADLDGGWLQDKAEELGLLVRIEVTEPCGGTCRCDDFPMDCLRYSPEVQVAIARSKP